MMLLLEGPGSCRLSRFLGAPSGSKGLALSVIEALATLSVTWTFATLFGIAFIVAEGDSGAGDPTTMVVVGR